MSSQIDRIIAWGQLITGIAVLAGLVLVVVELRQARSIATAEQMGAYLDNIFETRIASLGEVEIAPIMVKGCLTPSELSYSELYVYEKVISLDMGRAGRAFWIQQVGEVGGDWHRIAYMFYRDFLGSEIGRERYKQTRQYLDEPLREIADQILEEKSYIPCEIAIHDLKNAIENIHTTPNK